MPDAPDLQISDLALSLEPGTSVPLQPLVHRLRLQMSDAGFVKLLRAVTTLADARAPVDIELTSCRLVEGGAEVSARAGKGLLKAALSATIAATVLAGREIRCELTNLAVPAWVPVDRFLQQAIARANIAGLRLDPDNPRAVLLDPAALLEREGLPARLAPGAWTLAIAPMQLDLAYGAVAAETDDQPPGAAAPPPASA